MSCACMISYLSVRVLAFFLSFDLTHTPCIIGVCVGSTGRHLLHVVSFNFFKCPVPQLTQVYCWVRDGNKTNWHRHEPETRVLLYFKIIFEVWLWDVMCVYEIIFVCAWSRFLFLTHTPCIIGVCVGSTGRHLLHVLSFYFLKWPPPQVT